MRKKYSRLLIRIFFFIIAVTKISFICADDKSIDGLSSIDSIQKILPSNKYKIIDWNDELSDLLVINIQDYHAHYKTQKQYCDLLTLFADNNDIFSIPFIGIEGSHGVIDTTFALSYPDKKINKIIANKFLKDGVISGVEYYSIVADNPLPIVGVDNASLYRKNIEFYTRLEKDLLPEKNKSLQMLDYIEQVYSDFAIAQFEGTIHTLFVNYYNFQQSKTGYTDFALYLYNTAINNGIDVSRYLQVMSSVEILKSERKLDKRRLKDETFTLFTQLKDIMSNGEVSELQKAQMQFSFGKISFYSFFEILLRDQTSYGVTLTDKSSIVDMRDILLRLKNIREPLLRAELDRLLEKILEKISSSEQETKIFQSVRMLTIMKKMLRLSATKREFEYFIQNQDEFSVSAIAVYLKSVKKTSAFIFSGKDYQMTDGLLYMASRFYQEAISRDKTMLDFSLEMNKKFNGHSIVLITGGFHSEGLAQLCKNRKLSYVIIRPVIEGTDFTTPYKSVMLNGLDPFSSMLTGLGTQLMLPSWFSNLLHPENETVLLSKWFIFAQAIDELYGLDTGKLDMIELNKRFNIRQAQFMTALESNLRDRFSLMLEKDILPAGYIHNKISMVERVLDKVQFDFSKLQYFRGSLSIPVILKNDHGDRVVLRLRDGDAKRYKKMDFAQVIEDFEIGKVTLDVFSEESLKRNKRVTELIANAGKSNIIPVVQDNLIMLASLFGISTAESLLENYSFSELNSLLSNMPTYEDLAKIKLLAPSNQALLNLMRADLEGFFDLTYQIVQNDDNEESTEYIQKLVESVRRLKPVENSPTSLPEFIIEPASIDDLYKWFAEPIPRVFRMDQWVDAIAVSNHTYFFKARDFRGNIYGLITASSMPEINVVYVNFFEISSNIRRSGIGTALLLEIIRRSIGASILLDTDDIEAIRFYEKLGFTPLGIEKQVSMDLLPLPDGSRYFELTPEAGKKLIHGTTKPKQGVIIRNQTELDRFSKIPLREAVELMGQLMMKYGSIGYEEELFIISRMIAYLGLNINQATQLYNTIRLDYQTFYDTLQQVYDKMVDQLMDSFDTPPEDDIALSVIQLDFKSLPKNIPISPEITTPEIDDYRAILKDVLALRDELQGAVASAFDKPVGEKGQSVKLAQQVLQQFGLFYDIEIVSPYDPRIADKSMVLIDTTVYVNELISRGDFYFYLAHELSHLLDPEESARIRDVENIWFMKQTSRILSESIFYTDNPERKQQLMLLADQIRYRALLYELQIITARLQISKYGKIFLVENRLPHFVDVNTDYIKAIAQSAPKIIEPVGTRINNRRWSAGVLGLRKPIRDLVIDNEITDKVFARILQTKIMRYMTKMSIENAGFRPSDIDIQISSWIDNQWKKRFWQIHKTSLPPPIKSYVNLSKAELGYINIRDVEKKISSELRRLKDKTDKSELEKAVVQWLKMIIRENIKPVEGISEIPQVVQQRCANCLGYSKLFDSLATQFGINVSKTIIDYTINGKRELHAANLIRYSDGSVAVVELIDILSMAEHKQDTDRHIINNGFIVRLEQADDGQEGYRLVSQEELNKIPAGEISGLTRRTVDAFSYLMRAGALLQTGDAEGALRIMLTGYKISPDVPYIAYNTAQLAFLNWMERQKNEISTDAVVQKMKEFYEEYKLFELGADSWENFYRDLDMLEDQFILVNSIGSIGGGDGKIPPYRKKVEPISPVERIWPELPRKEQKKEKPSDKSKRVLPNPESVWTTLDLENPNIRFFYKDKKKSVSTQTALDQYRVNQLAGNDDGLSISTASHLIKIGRQIETLIKQQQYDRVQKMLMGLDTQFAERIMKEFPWILVFMMELYPEWWHGKDLRQIAQDMQLMPEREDDLKKQITTVKTVKNSIFVGKETKRDQDKNPLWQIISSDRIRNVMERLSERGQLDATHYRVLYEFLQAGNRSKRILSQKYRSYLFGKRDELPIQNGLNIKGDFILGGDFVTSPDSSQVQLYRSFLTTLVAEHPEEIRAVVLSEDKLDILARIGDNLNLPLDELLRESRGVLAVVADEILLYVDQYDLADGIRTVLIGKDASFILEALFSSNLVRGELQDIKNNIIRLNILDSNDRAVLQYLDKYYVDGDEQTDQFKNSIEIIERVSRQYPFINERLVTLAMRLQRLDSGKLFYALLEEKRSFSNTLNNIPDNPIRIRLNNYSVLDKAM